MSCETRSRRRRAGLLARALLVPLLLVQAAAAYSVAVRVKVEQPAGGRRRSSGEEPMRAFMADIERYKRQPGQGWVVTAMMALYSHPAFAGVAWYRFGRAMWLRRRNVLFFLGMLVHRILYPLVRAHSGVELSPTVEVGEGLWIGHFGPTLIHPEARIGSHVTLHQGVTIGEARSGVPVLGDNVSIGAGATVVGGISIGNHATIAAGAVVTKDVPDWHVAYGVPAQLRAMQMGRSEEPMPPLRWVGHASR